ncbi:hypothetical protein DIPPA_14651 [Diplonema papillatum]|nr:hypothetical protein DIPPA_14651 [Diplonema papillatum]
MVEHDSLNDTQPRLATTQPACEGIVQEARRRTVPVAPLPANFDCEDDLLRGPCGGALSPSASDAPRDHPTHQAHLLGFTPPSSLLLGPAHSAFAPDPSFTLEDDDSVSGHLHRLDPRRHKKPQSTTSVSFRMDGEDADTEHDAASPHISIDHLPETMERWAALKRGMHEVTPEFTVSLRKEASSPFVRYYGIVVFLMTQGSGKDKIFKLVQNASLLASSVSEVKATRVFCAGLEEQLSKARKTLRTFKIFSEANKMLFNAEEDVFLHRLMLVGNMYSIIYFACDHIVGSIELGFVSASQSFYDRAKRWKNIFSLLRLVSSFFVDAIHYRNGLTREKVLAKEIPGTPSVRARQVALTECTAIRMHRNQLRRNFAANIVNLLLLLSSLQVYPFSRISMTWVALGGIFTAVMGMYKVVRRVVDNQLTLQFC